MKQVININFQGRIVPIELTAYEVLKSYIESLNRHFENEEGKEEIINDIENRIGELFQERLKAGATCIEDEDVNAIIKSIGRPEDLDDTEKSSSNTKEQTSKEQTFSNTGKRRLFRDENHKLVGGVCSGLANYFDIDIAIVRIVFAILLFSFGIGFIPYIIFWIAVPSSATTVIGSRRKKLYRDTEDKYIGGVASGLANYFSINVWIPRVIFLLPLLGLFSHSWRSFGYSLGHEVFNLTPGPLFIYIILWIVLPEAKTTAEKLEMKGEKVDINSIKESVVEEMKGVQQRVQKFGKEAASVATEKGKVFGTEATSIAKRSSGLFERIVTVFIKTIVYGIIAILGFSLVVSLFAVGIAALRVFPLKDFLFTSGYQNLLAWGTLIFFIIAPMIGVITWIIRKIAKIKTGSKMIRLGFAAMWVVGWVCVIFLVVSISKDFSYSSNLNQEEILLNNSKVNALEITNVKPGVSYTRRNWFSDGFFSLTGDDDNATLRNVKVNIAKSSNDSFHVSMLKFANGSKVKYADTLASLINFTAQQQESTLVLERGININTKDKFRNQRVIVTIYVPIGKKIKVQNNIGTLNQISFKRGISVNNNDEESIEFNNIETGWETGVWYIMTKDGLQTIDGKPANTYKKNGVKINEDGIDIRDGKNRIRINENGISTEDNTNDSNDDEIGTYRYNDATPLNKIDSAKIKLQKEEKQFKDSLEEQKKKIDKQLEKYNKKTASIYNITTPNNLLMRMMN